MKLIFISNFQPARGNLSEYADYLINELLKNKKINKIIILSNYFKGSKKIEIHGKLKIIRCWENDSLLTPLKILNKIIKENSDVVHFNIHMMSWGKGKICNFFGAMTPFLSKLFKKTIVTLHSIVEVANIKEIGIKTSFLDKIGSSIATNFILSTDRTTVTLKKFIPVLNKKYKKNNIVHIPHGTLENKIKKIKTGGNTILTFGFWRDNKNLPFVIETFKQLKKKNLKLIVAGTTHPNFKGYLEKIKSSYKHKNIEFKGYIPKKNIRKIFLSATLVVLPYTTATGTSGTVNLAASFGKPIIVTDLPEMRELIKEEKLSLILVKKKNKKDFSDKIIKILNDKNLQKKHAEKNLKSVKKISFKIIAKKFFNLYEEVLS